MRLGLAPVRGIVRGGDHVGTRPRPHGRGAAAGGLCQARPPAAAGADHQRTPPPGRRAQGARRQRRARRGRPSWGTRRQRRARRQPPRRRVRTPAWRSPPIVDAVCGGGVHRGAWQGRRPDCPCTRPWRCGQPLPALLGGGSAPGRGRPNGHPPRSRHVPSPQRRSPSRVRRRRDGGGGG